MMPTMPASSSIAGFVCPAKQNLRAAQLARAALHSAGRARSQSVKALHNLRHARQAVADCSTETGDGVQMAADMQALEQNHEDPSTSKSHTRTRCLRAGRQHGRCYWGRPSRRAACRRAPSPRAACRGAPGRRSPAGPQQRQRAAGCLIQPSPLQRLTARLACLCGPALDW